MKTEKYFDDLAKKYDKKAWGVENAPWVKWGWRVIRKEVGRARNSLIVDLGTGTGNVILELLKTTRDSEFIGVDISRGMIKEARKKFKKMGLKNVKLMVSHLDRLKLPENSVDFFVSGGAFHHIKNKEKVIRNLFRMLKPEGKIINADQFKPGKVYRKEVEKLRERYPESAKVNDRIYREFMKKLEQDKRHPREFHITPYEFREILRKTGFVGCRVFLSLQPNFSVVAGKKPRGKTRYRGKGGHW
ncbi:MAG: methyltransferase domain-containing protein [Candidatus Aenigmarchaeota archaeon]|nr:methyltransferase domain-containing protein [Candidatus Aenigmarchaeota archaeon]